MREVLLRSCLVFIFMISGVAVILAEPVNVVVIVVDDLGYADLSCIGLADDVRTPNMDRLAAEGIRFTNAYATAPICNASRIALMTGRYQQRQATYWYSGPGLHRTDFPTLAETLKDAGYATAYVGKFHHSSQSDGPDGRGFPLNHGFGYLYGFAGGTKHYLHHKREFEYKGDMLEQGPLWVNREQEDVEGFTTQLFGAEARRWLREHRSDKFYLHLSFNAVHNFTYQLPPEYLEENGIQPFADWNPLQEGYWEWRSRLGYPVHPEGRAYYLGQLHLLDQEIGRVLDELDALEIRGQTLVVLVSDNGGSLVTYANNEPLKGGKYTLFEGGTRVPMMISFPRSLPTGQVSRQVVSTLDLFPTVCAIAGVPFPSGLDGIDLSPALKTEDSNNSDRGPLFWDTGHEMAVRDGKWKLLVTRSVPNDRLQITETPIGTFLYDLENDPGESVDLSSKFPEVRERLAQALKEWQEAVTRDQATK